jgi:FkbM family methyltransferase
MPLLSVKTFKDPLNAFLLLKRTYKNWFEIIADYSARKPLEHALLRDGQSISLDRKPSSLTSSIRHYHRWYDPSIYNLIGLARLLGNGWKIQEIESDYLLLSHEPSTLVKCRLNQGTDVSLLGEIYIREVYGTDFQDKVVVDVGAYTADSAVYFAGKGARLVIALEPDPRNFQLAKENIELNGLSEKIKLVKLALSVETGSSKLGLDLETPNITKVTDSDDSVNVDTITVEGIMNRFSLQRIDALKLNCEGCEYGIIRNLSPETFAKIGSILLEFHSGPKDLPRILSAHGFKISVKGGTLGYLTANKDDYPNA